MACDVLFAVASSQIRLELEFRGIGLWQLCVVLVFAIAGEGRHTQARQIAGPMSIFHNFPAMVRELIVRNIVV